MKKALTFALAFSCLAVGLNRSSFAQQHATSAVFVATESGNREQDNLKGPVRRVRVETAAIIPKDGDWVEGPREVLGITTYDAAGRKIDSAVYPADHRNPDGKEEYVYDHQGNVVEMILRSADGSMLSKESYKYEFDQLGNWTKMSGSVAVYENGKIVFEPTGITYRTISYYYNQAIEKLSASSPKSKVLTPSTSSTPLPNSTTSPTDSSRPATPSAQVIAIGRPPSDAVVIDAQTELVTAPASVSPAMGSPTAPGSSVATSSETRTTPVSAAAPSVVRHVTEEELRQAAVELPKPEYSEAAQLARAGGKVEVQVLVDERGYVTNAQATSGNALLGAAAEAAARKARFSLPIAGSGATKVFGVISYDFVVPTPTVEAPTVTSPTIERTPAQPDSHKPDVRALPATAALVDSQPKTPADYSEAARASFNNGVTLQSAGRYAEAAAAFNLTIKANPNDAQAYAKLGMAYSALDKHQDAIVVYKMALQINGSVLGAPAYYMWGHSYLALDKNSEAISAFKQALVIKRTEAVDSQRNETQSYPSLEQLHYGLGIANLNLRRFSSSVNELTQVVKLNPKNAEAYYALAIAHLSNGNRRGAEVQQKTLRSLNPDLAQRITKALAAADVPSGCLNIVCPRWMKGSQ